MKKLAYGVGINDSDYEVQFTINGKRVSCPYHMKWRNMLQRCYSENYHVTNPTYVGCEVSEEWKTFSNFKAWMEGQEWINRQLDKDILFPNNKLYSSETCVFISQSVNKFLVDRKNGRGEYMLGVDWHKRDNKFRARCNDEDNKNVHLGLFDTEIEAHLAWKAYKHKLACKLADEQDDPRVAEALRKRFAPDSTVLLAPDTRGGIKC